MSKTAGVVIDSWKLPIFKRHLDEAGFEYTERHMTPSTIVLMVKMTMVAGLQPIVQAANDEAARSKAN